MKVYVVMMGGGGYEGIEDIFLTPEGAKKCKENLEGYAYFMDKRVRIVEYEAKE